MPVREPSRPIWLRGTDNSKCLLRRYLMTIIGNPAAPPYASMTMVLRYFFSAIILVVQFANQGICMQAPAAKLDRVIGEVSAIDAGAKQLTVKSDAGPAVTAIL